MTFAPQPEEVLGTIEEILSSDILHEVANDGAHTYLHNQEETKTQLPVTNEALSIIVPLTSKSVDVVQFDKSFITLKVSITFNISGFTGTVSDSQLGNALELFVGLKHASDCFKEYIIYHKGKPVGGTLQTNATTESFLYHTYRSQDSLSTRRGIHTVASCVAKNENHSICGEYLSLTELKAAQANNQITVPFVFTIPFNDILAFQQFTAYPSELFGELELRFKFNKAAFVCLPCDPTACIKNSIVRNGLTSGITSATNYGALNQLISKEYVQAGDKFKAIIGCSYTSPNISLTAGDVTITPASMEITDCFSTVVGYDIEQEAIEGMRNKFESEPWVKFSQHIDYLPFSTPASAQSLYTIQQAYLNHTTDFVLMFPRTQNECGGTVSKNPGLQELSLQVMNRKYPEMPLDTYSERFAQLMMNSSDNFLEAPNHEYAQSVSIVRATSTGKVNPLEDLTSFLVTLKVERPSAMGMICDGLDSGGRQTSIRLSAKPIYSDSNIDEYCTQSPPAPVLVTVNDSFWIFSSRNGGTCIYEPSRDFNEVVGEFMSS